MNDELEHLKNLLIKASSLIDNKKYDEAIQSLLAIEPSFPNVANIRWLIGTAFTRKGNYFEAIKSYSDAFRLNANLPFIEFKKDNIVSKLDLVSREEFEALKKILEKQELKIKKLTKKSKKAKKS